MSVPVHGDHLFKGGHETMKKILAGLALFLLAAAPAGADALYTVTVRNVTVAQTQDAILDVMTNNKFTIEDVDPYRITFMKTFSDLLMGGTRVTRSKFNLLQRDDNVKMIVSQVDDLGPMKQARSIDHLIPYIKEIKNRLDGTPLDQIVNETNDGVAPIKPKAQGLGIVMGERTPEGVAIQAVAAGSRAEAAGLTAGDIVTEINGRSVTEYRPEALQQFMEEKDSAKGTLYVGCLRDGTPKLAAIPDTVQ